MTIHVLDARDYAAFHEAMTESLRASRLDDTRFTVAGVTPDEADALLGELLAFAAEPRTGVEIEAWLDERLAPRPGKPVLWALRTYAPLLHAATGGPWSFGRTRRYLAGPRWRRPASLRRPGAFDAPPGSPLPRGLRPGVDAGPRDLRARLSAAGSRRARLARRGGRGRHGRRPERLDAVRRPRSASSRPRTRRRRRASSRCGTRRCSRTTIGAGSSRPRSASSSSARTATCCRRSWSTATWPGVWRPTEAGIEATAFHPLDDDAWDGLETEARGLRAFLADREPLIFHGRFAHWWGKLPEAEVRLLGA